MESIKLRVEQALWTVLGLVERAILFYIDHAPQWLLRVKKNPPAVSCHDGLCLASLLLSSRTAEWVCLCRLLLCRQVSCLCRPSASSSRFCGPHLSHHLCLPPLLMSNHAGTRVGVGFLFRRRLGTHCRASRTVRAPAAVPSQRASSPPAELPARRASDTQSVYPSPVLRPPCRWAPGGMPGAFALYLLAAVVHAALFVSALRSDPGVISRADTSYAPHG
jgi:hypothetical protein